jgi:unsaturated rhamnogalacturonyl hydrolase
MTTPVVGDASRPTGKHSPYALIDRVAAVTRRLRFKRWGFGESIAMHALLAAGGEARACAAGLIRAWARTAPGLAGDPLAHVAPGVPLLELYRLTADEHLVTRAGALAAVLEHAPVGRYGARIHRPDLPGWDREIWVDCMHLDGPFLALLAQLDHDHHWADLGAELLLTHGRVLQDERSGLFAHGFDDATGKSNQVFWGRGQGWALLGLVDTLAALPNGHAAAGEITQRLLALADGLSHTEAEAAPGCWHTVVDAAETYLEPSVGAFVALGVGLAVDRQLLPGSMRELAQRALAATVAGIDASGHLTGVSDATPVGANTEHYGVRKRGVHAWGQGPALLALVRAADRDSA